MLFHKAIPTILSVALAASVLAGPALAAETVKLSDAYARFVPGSKAGAVFLQIENLSKDDERLIAASTPIAGMVEAHANVADGNGMMQMLPMENGILVPGYETVLLKQGGVHLMVMGLTSVPKDGESFPVTLKFEHAGDLTLDVTVDNKRKPQR